MQDAWGWCTGMTQRDDMGRGWERGSGLGTHIHPWRIHVDVWQNQYSIVKQNKVKFKKNFLNPTAELILKTEYILKNICPEKWKPDC